MARRKPAISPAVIHKLREILSQLNHVFPDKNKRTEFTHLAKWTLDYFSREFEIARTPHQLQPKTHMDILNLEILCTLIAPQETIVKKQMDAVRQGVDDAALKIPPKNVFLRFTSSKRLAFEVHRGRNMYFIMTSFLTAPWNESYYYWLGQMSARLFVKKKVPKRVVQNFKDAVRANLEQHSAIANTKPSDPGLLRLFQELNRTFFGNELPEVTIRWGRRNKRKLGHWDALRREIVINPLLTKPEVPEYVLRFIVFHEMLHIALPPYRKNGRLVRHHREFKQAEKQFPYYHQSDTWLRENWNKHYRRYAR